MNDNLRSEKKHSWYNMVSWSIVLPVISVLVLTFLYYHELGFFAKYELPTEYIRVEIINSIKYIAVFIFAIYFLFLFSFLGGTRISYKAELQISMRAINALFIFTIIFTIPGILSKSLTLYWTIFFFLFAKTMLIDAEFEVRNYRSVRISKPKHIVAMFLILLAFCCSLSFCLGYFERIFTKNVFIKSSKNETLMRSYNEYSIYCERITVTSGVERKLIIIEYSPNNMDTLFRTTNKEFFLK